MKAERSGEAFDLNAVLVLLGTGLIFFAPYASRAGLHLDDHGFYQGFAHSGWRGIITDALHYVPGRNLYIPFFYLLDRACGGSVALMHLFGLALDLVNPILVMALARRLGASRGAALSAAGLFLVWPNHGETHWWTSAIMMNLLTTTLVLGAFLVAGRTKTPRLTRLALAALLYAIALFDYDQVFFLWIPLLAFARWADDELRGRHLLAAAGGFILLDGMHFTARMLSPFSSGGRPVPHLDVFFLSLRHAVTQTLVPIRAWPMLQGFPGGIPAALIISVTAAALWAFLCIRRWNDDGRPSAMTCLILFGIAWWAFSYLPNFFWYISPRHNYLPSVGTALIVTSLAASLARSRRLRHALALAGALFFAFSGASAWSDGAAWAASTALQAHFAEEVVPILPPGTGGVYLLGAPKVLRTAPAFFHPQEHLHALARASGQPMSTGDNAAAVNRLGLFSTGQVDLFGNEAPPRFEPLSSAIVIARRGSGRFERACIMRLATPGLPPRTLHIGPGTCAGVLAREAPVALVDSHAKTTSEPSPLLPTLVSALFSPGPDGTFDLTLVWRTGRSRATDFAAYPVIFDAAGQELFRSIYAASPAEHRIPWPLFDDRNPPSRWRTGQMITERYRLRQLMPWQAEPARLRLVLFGRRPGSAWEILPPPRDRAQEDLSALQFIPVPPHLPAGDARRIFHPGPV